MCSSAGACIHRCPVVHRGSAAPAASGEQRLPTPDVVEMRCLSLQGSSTMVSGSSLLRRLVLLASLSVALPGVSAQQVILPKPSQIYPTIWPQPKMMQINESIPNGGPTLYVDPDDFSVTWDQSIDSRDPLLTQSQTLMHRLFPISADDQLDMSLGKLTGLFVHVDCPQCPFGIDALDQTGTSESYNLSITLDSNGNGVAQLYAPTSWGAIWGLESFVQLLSVVGGNYLLYNSSVTVYDAPRFAYRGVMIDTANHFIDTKTLRHILDGMSANKLNVLHWMQRSAVTTSIQSDVFANLTELGSFDPTESVYTQDDVFDLVSYAEQRGIHVVIENGGLENAAAIGASHPEVIACPNLLAQGYPMNLQVAMDPFANATFDFLANYWHELDQSSTDFVHLGGDQISHACWRESASVRQYREDNPGTSYDDIQALFITNVWNGIMQNPGNGDPTQPFPIFSYSQSIMYRASVDNYPGCFPQDEFAPGWFNVTFEAKDQQTVAAVAEAQLSVIYSGDAWDLTSSTTQAKAVVAGMMDTFDDWIDVYMYNITDGVQNPDWLQYVLGGQVQVYTTQIDANAIQAILWPRGSAAAEKLWSSQAQTIDAGNETLYRLQTFVCTLQRRGLRSGSLRPGFCSTNVRVRPTTSDTVTVSWILFGFMIGFSVVGALYVLSVIIKTISHLRAGTKAAVTASLNAPLMER